MYVSVQFKLQLNSFNRKKLLELILVQGTFSRVRRRSVPLEVGDVPMSDFEKQPQGEIKRKHTFS